MKTIIKRNEFLVKKYMSNFERGQCHNNCKKIYDILLKEKMIDESAKIIGGWFYMVKDNYMIPTYHFTIFYKEEYYDIDEGIFMPLFELDLKDWKKDILSATFSAYYHSEPLKMLNDINELTELFYEQTAPKGSRREEYIRATEMNKMSIIQKIYGPTTEFSLYFNNNYPSTELLNKDEVEMDRNIENYIKVIRKLEY